MNPYSRAKLVQNHSIFSSFLPFKKMQEPLIYKYSLYNQGFFWFLHKESTGFEPARRDEPGRRISSPLHYHSANSP